MPETGSYSRICCFRSERDFRDYIIEPYIGERRKQNPRADLPRSCAFFFFNRPFPLRKEVASTQEITTDGKIALFLRNKDKHGERVRESQGCSLGSSALGLQRPLLDWTGSFLPQQGHHQMWARKHCFLYVVHTGAMFSPRDSVFPERDFPGPCTW